MIKNAPKMLQAFGLSAALIASPAAAQDISGWDRPENAEFVMRDVQMKFLVPEIFYTERDIHLDCDLLLRQGDRLQHGDAIPTNGFAMQFNAETDYTRAALAEIDRNSGNPEGTTMGRLQAYQGQLNPHALNGAINTHLSPQHGITIEILRDAAAICIADHSDHGVRVNELKTFAGGVDGIHPHWR